MKIWHLKFGSYNPTEKSTLGCARTLSEVTWLSTLAHLPHCSEVWRSMRIPAVAVNRKLNTKEIEATCNKLYGKMCSSKHCA